ncbi:MAG: AarF/ABC1/UbiB kinase family protein [Clostridia bacterium]|nr:AarF/ABC1/UbiB kinase family protein [Clostridia bacterium]
MVTRLLWGYRNYRRIGQILRVALGLAWAMFRETRFKKPLSSGSANPYRHVRRALEELGPTFIKLGQFLSARPDLIPAELASELAQLQDKVLPLKREEVRQQLSRSFGRAPEEMFRLFDYEPLAAASIAQVHKALLHNGREVAVKIQRPNLQRLAREDLSILRNHKRRIARSFPGRLVDVEEFIDDLGRKIRRELDFTNEAFNMDTFRGILAPIEGVIVPQVHWEYTTKEILVMDYTPGVKPETLSSGERRLAAWLLLRSLLLPVFQEGIFHGDPHPGNILFQPGGRIAWVDFGSVGRLDDAFRRRMMILLVAVAQRDAAKVAELTLEWGQVAGPYNPAHLYEDTAELLERVSRLGKGQVHLGQLMVGMMEISLTHNIKLPESFLLLGRALLAGEGQARRLDPDADLLGAALTLAGSRLQEQLVPKLEQEDFYLKSLIYRESLPTLYRHTGEILANLSRGRQQVVFSHQGLEPLARAVEKAGLYIALGLISGILLVTSRLQGTDQSNLWPVILGVTGVLWLFTLVLWKITWK